MKKRILHVIDHLDLGGAQAVLLDLVSLMNRDCWQCEVASMHGRGLFAELLEEQGIVVHELSATLWPPGYINAFLELQPSFDLFHFHLSGANWIAKPLAALLGDQPCIAHDHASADLRFRGQGAVILDSLMHRFSSHIIAVSPEVKEFLIHHEALSTHQISVLANGVNVENFRPFTKKEREEARHFFNLPAEASIIGTAGRLASEKNQQMLLHALARVREKGVNILLLLAGSGPQEKNLRTLASELGILSSIRFLGKVEQRVLFYRALDLFVLTSRYEGLPMVLLEAMASEIPVVSTDLEGINHALEGGRYGTLVPVDDLEKLADTLLVHLQEKSSLLHQARQKVESDFSAQEATQKLERLYSALLSL